MGSKLVRWALLVGLGSLLPPALPLFPLTVTDFTAVQAAELPDTSVQMLAGGDWNQWHNDKKIEFVDGFISGSHWVASNSMFPQSMFSDETVRAGAQILWKKVTAEFGKAIDNPKLQLQGNTLLKT